MPKYNEHSRDRHLEVAKRACEESMRLLQTCMDNIQSLESHISAGTPMMAASTVGGQPMNVPHQQIADLDRALVQYNAFANAAANEDGIPMSNDEMLAVVHALGTEIDSCNENIAEEEGDNDEEIKYAGFLQAVEGRVADEIEWPEGTVPVRMMGALTPMAIDPNEKEEK